MTGVSQGFRTKHPLNPMEGRCRPQERCPKAPRRTTLEPNSPRLSRNAIRHGANCSPRSGDQQPFWRTSRNPLHGRDSPPWPISLPGGHPLHSPGKTPFLPSAQWPLPTPRHPHCCPTRDPEPRSWECQLPLPCPVSPITLCPSPPRSLRKLS